MYLSADLYQENTVRLSTNHIRASSDQTQTDIRMIQVWGNDKCRTTLIKQRPNPIYTDKEHERLYTKKKRKGHVLFTSTARVTGYTFVRHDIIPQQQLSNCPSHKGIYSCPFAFPEMVRKTKRSIKKQSSSHESKRKESSFFHAWLEHIRQFTSSHDKHCSKCTIVSDVYVYVSLYTSCTCLYITGAHQAVYLDIYHMSEMW